MRGRKQQFEEWKASLKTPEVCPKCKKGFLFRYLKAYWCERGECKYGEKELGDYRGAVHEIVNARLASRKFYDADYKRTVEEDFTEDLGREAYSPDGLPE